MMTIKLKVLLNKKMMTFKRTKKTKINSRMGEDKGEIR